MGIYQYMLRSDTRKTVSGDEIGHFMFGYKHGWDWYPGRSHGPEGRIIEAKERHAEHAAYKLGRLGVKLYVVGEFSCAEHKDGMTVYRIDGTLDNEPFSQFTEELRTTPAVGKLYKRGRKFHLVLD